MNFQISKFRLRYLVEVLTVAALCGFFFFYRLGSFGLVGADEPRYAQVAREMIQRNDFITPTLHGEPWLEKPALYYWRATAAFRTFGVEDWSARLPSGTFAFALVIIIYFHMRRFRSGAQMDAALITASAAAIIGFARGASTDMQLAAPFAIAMLGWYAWYETGSKFWLFDLYFFLAVGTLAKGPVAPGLAAIIVILFAGLRRDWRLALRTLWVPGILTYFVVVLPWFIMVQLHNPNFLHVFIFEHNLERFTTNTFHHKYPFWYYLPVWILSLLPWTVYGGAALIETLRETWQDWRSSAPGVARESVLLGDSFSEFLVLWAIVPVLFFSISSSKLPGYILPAIPPCTILIADYLQKKRGHPVNTALLAIHSLLVGLLAAAVSLLPYLVLEPKHLPAAHSLWIAFVIGSTIAAAIFVVVRLQGYQVLRFVTMVPIILVAFFLLRSAAWAIDSAYSSRPVARYLAKIEADNLKPAFRPTAVFDVRRDVEYGLGFYRDEKISSYDRGEIPKSEHLLVAQEGEHAKLKKLLAGRYFVSFGPPGPVNPQHLEVFWVSSSPGSGE